MNTNQPIKLAAVIPTLGERPELLPLMAQLIREDVDVITLGLPGENLHHMWNKGAALARDWRQADAIAILNDDIRLPNGALAAMYAAMQTADFACVGVDPQAPFGVPQTPKASIITGGVERLTQGVSTWCFLVAADAWQDIDEAYEWWWGVSDLFVKIQEHGGRLGYVQGLGIEHVGSGTAKNHPWTEAAKLRDAKRWRETH
jgi:GT2 family glycosyltransferase